jgi:hypothetical protein
LYAAAELIGGMSAMYTCNEVLFAPSVLARSTLEHCAHVFWVWGRPGDSTEHRMARVFLEELASAEFAKMNAGRLLGKNSAEHQDRRKVFKTLQADTARCLPEPVTDGDGNPLLLDQQLPGPEEMFVRMHRFLNPGQSEPVSRGVYGLLSNYTHPTAYPTRELFGVVEDESGRKTPRKLDDVEHHDRLIQAVIVPFYSALAYVMSYHGWPGERLNGFADRIDCVFPGIFVRKEAI